MKKKLLYIGHYFHKKTKSNLFLQDILKQDFEIYNLYIYENNQKLSEKDLRGLECFEFDTVIIFQLYPDRQSLDSFVTFEKGIFVPMLDGYPDFGNVFWQQYDDFKVLSFSSHLYQSLRDNGIFDTSFFQYFPAPKNITNYGDERECYFWQRRNEINLDTIKKVMGNQIDVVNFNKTVDPGEIKPNTASQLYKIREVEWEKDPLAIDKVIEQSKFYFVPRSLEGIGQAFLNAMNLGRIVISPNTPTMNEYIEDGKNGFLYDLNEPTKINLNGISYELFQKNVKDSMNKGFLKWKESVPKLKEFIYTDSDRLGEKIRLAIDAEIFKNYNVPGASRTGIYKSCERIVKNILRSSKFDVVFYSEFNLIQETRAALNFLFADVISNITILSEKSDFSRVDAFLSLYAGFPDVALKSEHIKKYCIINDCIPELRFSAYGENFPWFFSLTSQLRKVSKVFTISEYTKKDILRLHPEVREEDIVVCYLGDPLNEIESKETREEIFEFLHLNKSDNYCLSVCSLEPRKNLRTVIQSFFDFIDSNNIKNLKLVLAGSKWSNFEHSLSPELVEKINKSNSVIFAGYISDEKLKALYSHALFFVYTSHYEGFGLPLLEAMNSGTPVISSNTTSMPEVVGDAALLVTPDSIQEHIEAYENYYFYPTIREKFKLLGLERAKSFTWNECASKIIKTIEEDFAIPIVFPSISVVLVTQNLIKKNEISLFRRTLESINKQVFPGRIEVLVIDRASNDGTRELLDSYKKEGLIDTLIAVTGQDHTVSDAMNKGIELSDSDYVCFLNPNSYYHNKFGLFTSIKRINQNNLDYCFSDALFVNPTNNLVDIWKGTLEALPFGKLYCHQTMVCKRSMLKKLNGLDSDYKVCGVSDLCIKALTQGFKGMNAGINFVTYYPNPTEKDAEGIVRVEYSNSFYNHVGRKIGLSRLDCFNLWNLRGVVNLSDKQKYELIFKLQKPEWISYAYNAIVGTSGYNPSTFYKEGLVSVGISPALVRSPGERLGRKVAVVADLLLRNQRINKFAHVVYRYLKPLYIKSKPYVKIFLQTRVGK